MAGGPHTAFERGERIGCNSLQIFVKSPNRWQGAKLKERDVESFHAARAAAPQPVIAHAAYLINLAGNTPELLEKSRKGLADELERCQLLGVDALVVHPGAHMGAGEEEGIDVIARSLDAVLAPLAHVDTRLLLENTAGQGTTLGFEFEQLSAIIERSEHSDRLGVCLDTCHAFAAGYGLREEGEWRELLERLDATVGLARVHALHLNDSKHPQGSRRDRHESIGEGHIGDEAFARIVAEPAFASLPMILETPLGDDEKGHERDLARLRSLVGRTTG